MIRSRFGKKVLIWGTVTLVGVVALLVVMNYVWASLYPGPDQPIPFSHRLHVKTKGLQCFFCHNSAPRSNDAGMPPVDKCLLCHNVVASRFPPIRRIIAYKKQNQPIPWVKVNGVPEHVQFSHQAHLTQRIDCGHCHGNIRNMDRVRVAHKFDMNFCVTCHWKNGASTYCFTCHY